MILNQPGSGWGRLAEYVATQIPGAEIEGVWQFRTMKRDGRELGTVLLSRIDGEQQERRRIYTGRFVLVLKGKERGKFEAWLEEVGSGPVETLDSLLAGVRKRMEEEDPRPIPVQDWLPAPDGAPRLG